MGQVFTPHLFPFCPQNGDAYIIEGQTAASPFSLATAVHHFWRPREIRFSGTYNPGNTYTRDCTDTASYELIISSPYGSEEEMICGPAKPWVVKSSENVIVTLDEDGNLYPGWNGTDSFFELSDGSYVTRNGIYFELNPTPYPDSEAILCCAKRIEISGIYALQALGIPLPVEMVTIDGVQYAAYTNEVGSTCPTLAVPQIEVIKYWSFGGTYNETTGDPA